MLAENGHDPGEHANPRETATAAGLHYVSDDRPGFAAARRASISAIAATAMAGRQSEILRDPETLARIRSLAIPPAWTDVWISADPRGHLQATGRDARGRKQYRYHPAFREIRESTKYEHLIDFAQALPRIRAGVAAHMALRGLPREKVLATIVNLLETTLIRVGNSDYARDNKSYGLTTLNNPHIQVKGSELRFHFKGKSGKIWRLQVRDRRIAKIVKACQELPGQQLFQYVDDAGEPRGVTSSDVNDYLRAALRSRHHGQGFPDLGRHGPGGARLDGAGRRRKRHPCQAQPQARHRACRRASGQYDHHLPQMLHPSPDHRLLSGGHAGSGDAGRAGRGGVRRLPPKKRPSSPCCAAPLTLSKGLPPDLSGVAARFGYIWLDQSFPAVQTRSKVGFEPG